MKKTKIEKTPRDRMREEARGIHVGSIICKLIGLDSIKCYRVERIINERPSPARAEQDRTLIVRPISKEKVRANAHRHYYCDVIPFADIKEVVGDDG